MKKIFLFITAFFIVAMSITAQENIRYRRSSLHQIYIPCPSKTSVKTAARLKNVNGFNPDEDYTAQVLAAWNEYPFPEKYNNHEIDIKSISLPESLLEDDEDEDTDDKSKEKKKKVDEVQLAIEKAIYDNQIAKELVKKWYNYNNGKVNIDTLLSRAAYDASELDLAVADGQADKKQFLSGAAEELLGNTFVTFSYTKFISCLPKAEAVRALAYAAAEQIGNPVAKMAAKKAADVAYNKMKDGYRAVTKTYLYQLVWDEETSATFYNYWLDNTTIDAKAFEADKETFKMVLVGKDEASSTVYPQAKLKELMKEGYSLMDSTVVKRTVIRNTDKMYAQLAKNYEVFKPVVPVYTEKPLTAQIGMKEGLEGGEKFDVLECQITKDGKTIWKPVGVVVVDKKQIWDNRYAAGEEDGEKFDESVKATLFKGKATAGLYLRQQK
jgi:hypothetical protein